ncbi:hypothetical protein [Nocardiopsis dassonvillei]|uniref:hypothetical protein n=1 Tax=Nocardiopsis dassonvillei TaxID=2014 RepID=UPI003F544322
MSTTYRWRLTLTAVDGTRLTGRGKVTPGPDRSLADVRQGLIDEARGQLHVHLADQAAARGWPLPATEHLDARVHLDLVPLS